MRDRPRRIRGFAPLGPLSLVLVALLLTSLAFRGTADSRNPSISPQLAAPPVAWVTASEAPPASSAPIVLNLSANVSGGSPPYREVWMPGDGRTESNPTPPYVLINSGGQYRIVLTVTDSAGAIATGTSFPFAASSPSGGPAVQAGASVTFGAAPLAVQFTGTPSGGPVGNPIWYFGDGTPPVAGWNWSHTYRQPGSFAATLNASTPHGYNASYVITVLVVGPSEPPFVVANTTTTFACGPNGATLVHAALRSEATGGTPPYSYEWFFGDGSTGTGATITHQYSGPGNPIAGPWIVPRILVVDSRGSETTSSVQIMAGYPCFVERGPAVEGYELLGLTFGVVLAVIVVLVVGRIVRRRPPRASPVSPAPRSETGARAPSQVSRGPSSPP